MNFAFSNFWAAVSLHFGLAIVLNAIVDCSAATHRVGASVQRAVGHARLVGGDGEPCLFVASFAVGPGVCVWLALSELMPTRIRSNGMSIALLVNQFVSTVIAATFLPTVGQYGYATMFFYGAGCAALYFLTAAFLLPETKGKTLEEIEAHFSKA
ncbi:MFS transporter [Rugamonas sp. CCM 8940]|nr:MFS transporter [Rugamonas sp. CCM 8940]MBJ7313452.1 MFS transporter [Rugamonas sp. CCM 8940]